MKTLAGKRALVTGGSRGIGAAIARALADQRSLMPLGRHAEPADIAATVVFLASPAARQITGTTITVDGGLLA